MRTIDRTVGCLILSGAIFNLTGCLNESGPQPAPSPPAANAPQQSASPVAAQPNAPQTTQPNRPEAKPTGKPAAGKLAGAYCYSTSTPNLTAEAKLNVQGTSLTGNVQGMIHNQSAGYFTGYTQTATGLLSGDQAKVQLKIEVDGDKQTAEETWTVTDQSLKTKRETFGRVDCGELGQLSEKAKAAMSAPVTKPKPAVAIKPPTKEGESQIDFANGGNALKTKGAIVRDEQRVYIFSMKKGQTFIASITSPENNAVIELVGPDRKTIKREATNFEYALPADGDYRVIVGSVRGNAEFTLNANVK
jgi:hypothetical protein